MARLAVLTRRTVGSPLPSLELLSHTVRHFPATLASLAAAEGSELLIIDATTELADARALSHSLAELGERIMVVVTEAGFAALTPEWGTDEVVVSTAGPAEVDARIRLVLGKRPVTASGTIRASGLLIDEVSYSASLNGRPLDLTFKEFELLRFLAANRSRVFTRDQLLDQVWGSDYFGGTRTVDVHVRRLRAKLGELESLIGTVRNVGYLFSPAREGDSNA